MNNNFEKYLEIEKLLNTFFSKHNFCTKHCEKGWNKIWWIWCCEKDFFNDFFEEFNKERLEKHWNPSSYRNKCWYHCDTWCKLTSHKAPICLWYLCTPYCDYLKNIWIIWNWNEIIRVLAEIIDWNNKNFDNLKEKIENFIKIS